jgi:CHAT domain-containing protein
VLKAWYEASHSIDSKWNLGSFLMEMSNNTDSGFKLLEDLLKEPLNPQQAVRLRCRVATGYLEEHNLKKAQALLTEANFIMQRDFPKYKSGVPGYWFIRAEMEYFRTSANLLWRQGKFDLAVDQAKTGRAKGFELKPFEIFADSRQIQFSRMYHSFAANEVAVTLIVSGRLFEAEEALKENYALIKSYEFTDDNFVSFYRWLSDLYFAQGRYEDSLKISRIAQRIQKDAGLPEGTAQSIWTEIRINKNLIAESKWNEALQEFNKIDLAVGDNERVKPIARMVELRGLTLLNNGRMKEAIDTFASTLNWAADNFGPDHYFTSFKRGLYGIALSKDKDKKDLAETELERAIRGLTSPDSLSNQFEENPFRLSLRQEMFKTYLELLADSKVNRPEISAKAFAISNHLMNSTVQQAIADSAARAAIKQPGLGEVARLDQDAKTELTSLYSYVTAQAGETQQHKVNPEIVKAMRGRITELENIRREYKSKIKKEYPEYFQLLQPQAPSPKEVANYLGSKDVFISIIPADRVTYVFCVTKEGEIRFNKSDISANELKQLVQNIRQTLDVAELGLRAPNFKFTDSFRIYKQLLAPFEDLFNGKDHLIIATSGTLGQLPFSVLTRRLWSGKDYLQAPWLIKDFAISHIASPNAWTALKRLEETPSGQQPLMAWGDPSFAFNVSNNSTHAVRSLIKVRSAPSSNFEKPSVDLFRYSDLPPLPETRDEVLALAKVLNANPQTEVLLGKDATRESVIKASESRALIEKQVIVFATHGLLPGDLPRLEQPALAMAADPDAKESPLLTLEDVMGLRLNADWVILSACNTAGADGKVEEALSGLARGFFYAGSRSLLVTHWSVESESAMMITTETFRQYKGSDKLTRAKALQSGMLKVMSDSRYKHPAFWAPYALVGEGGR